MTSITGLSSSSALSDLSDSTALQATTPGTDDTSAADSTASTSSTSGLNVDSTTSGILGEMLTVAQQDQLNDVSVLLGTSSDDLFSTLAGGTSLSDLLSQVGAVDPTMLASVLQNGLLFDTQA